MKIEWRAFDEIAAKELYELMALRSQVFVVEQECAYQEMDGHDLNAMHCFGIIDDGLMAYARIVPAGEIYEQPSIGRVLIKEEFRKKGYARILFAEALRLAKARFPGQSIKLQAQTYLEDFYKSFGFKTLSEPYPDVGVWHVDMVLENEPSRYSS